MRKGSITGITFLLTLAVLVSCNNDEEKKKNEQRLLGVWTATEVRISGCTDPDSNSETITECTGSDCIRYTFSMDTSGAQLYYKEIITDGVLQGEAGTYTVGNKDITFCKPGEEENTCHSEKMEVNDSFLSLTDSEEDTGCTQVTFLTRISQAPEP